MSPPLRPALLAALLAIAPLGLLVRSGTTLDIHAEAIPLDPHDARLLQVGALRYLGGWSLSSDDLRFGGLSSLTLQRGRLVAIADDGTVVGFRIDARGKTSDVTIARLPDGPGDPRDKISRDSESSTYDPATQRTWVGFETTNQLWRYGPAFARAESHSAPPAMRHWPQNRGAETMTRLADGRFLVIEETGRQRDGSHEALLFAGDPTLPGPPPLIFGYRAPKGFNVTDAATLPDGRVILLHRHVSLWHGFSAALTLLDPSAIVRGRTIAGREIARLQRPLNVDNMEGIAIAREQGHIVLWLISDDNFSVVQRTLLMKFALAGF